MCSKRERERERQRASKMMRRQEEFRRCFLSLRLQEAEEEEKSNGRKEDCRQQGAD